MWWFTVRPCTWLSPLMLWIDFKLILLCDDSQFGVTISILPYRCELISNWYFYVMIHSLDWTEKFAEDVVNWFQIDTFMWWFTVFMSLGKALLVLWIDFKLILLCDDSQYLLFHKAQKGSCELISNWYFYVMIHSLIHHRYSTT